MKRLALLIMMPVLAFWAAAPTWAEPAPDGSSAAASWLVTQLEDGLMHSEEFDSPDVGLTIDVLLALDSVEGFDTEAETVVAAVESAVGGYIEFDDDHYSAATAKALVAAIEADADPRSFGGFDLVERLESMVTTESGAGQGRLADASSTGDFANTIGQAFAVRGLAEVGSELADEVTGYLLQQQCADGYFRLNFNDESDNADQTCDGATDETAAPDPDATAFAIIALEDVDADEAAEAAKRAAAWLAEQQGEDGSFTGGESTDAPNANSAGLAAQALAEADRHNAAQRAGQWVKGLQLTEGADAGAVAYDTASFEAATEGEIESQAVDQWRRATPQAVHALAELEAAESESDPDPDGVAAVAVSPWLIAGLIIVVIVGAGLAILAMRRRRS